MAHEKMLNVTNHQGNANQNHNEIALYICQNVTTIKTTNKDFPSGVVVKNPPANAGDTGSSPGPGRSRMLWSN